MPKSLPARGGGVLPLIALLLLTACKAPDVSAEIGAFAEAEKAVHAPLKAVLDKDLAQARKAQIDGLIAARKETIGLDQSCSDVVAVDFAGKTCALVDKFAPDENTVQLQLAQELLASLEAYIEAIDLLASSKAPEEIAASVTALGTDVKALTAATTSAEAKATGAAIERFTPVMSMVARMATEAERAATLRRVVREGDGAVEAAVSSLISVLGVRGHSRVQALYEEAQAASVAVETEEIRADPATYRAAMARLERAVAALNKESQGSLAGQLMAVRRTHAALAARLAAGASLEEVLQFTKELAQLRAAIETAKG